MHLVKAQIWDKEEGTLFTFAVTLARRRYGGMA
jgi:hypothetical protein